MKKNKPLTYSSAFFFSFSFLSRENLWELWTISITDLDFSVRCTLPRGLSMLSTQCSANMLFTSMKAKQKHFKAAKRWINFPLNVKDDLSPVTQLDSQRDWLSFSLLHFKQECFLINNTAPRMHNSQLPVWTAYSPVTPDWLLRLSVHLSHRTACSSVKQFTCHTG